MRKMIIIITLVEPEIMTFNYIYSILRSPAQGLITFFLLLALLLFGPVSMVRVCVPPLWGLDKSSHFYTSFFNENNYI